MRDTKQILRVVLKLMASVGLLWLTYVFVSGLFVVRESATEKFTSIELLPVMQQGEVRFIQLGRRKLLVVYDQHYYVAWADDPVYGCAIEYLQAKQRFKSICVESWFDMQGHVMPGSKTEVDLKVPSYSITDDNRLVIEGQ